MSQKHFLAKKLLFIDLKTKNIVDELDYENGIVVEFLDCVIKAFVDCGLYLQNKLPLENDNLKAFTTIDPMVVTTPKKLLLARLLTRPSLVPCVLNDNDEECSNKDRAVIVDATSLQLIAWWTIRSRMLIIWNCSNWWKNATLSCSKWSLEFSASFIVLKYCLTSWATSMTKNWEK